ncbi:MAG: hypothetical protein OER88_13875, partial [Planctomycetota bacterium]|nr:hypothetical protein [Planctomycetota bacterium]
ELLVLRARLDDVETRLRAGDVQVFDALVRAAVAGGADGVPEQLVPAVLSALRTLPGEVSRLRALFILRCRGTLSGVREGLIEAYRREPSRRVARAIESTLVELAHR